MLTGGCQCGAVRYEIAGDMPSTIYVCHCRECQKQTASAFGMSLPVASENFRLTEGSLSHWTRPADSGATVDCAFCPTCGTRVWHASTAAPGQLRVRGGSLDTPLDLGSAVHIWTTRKLDGVSIPDGAKTFPAQPE